MDHVDFSSQLNTPEISQRYTVINTDALVQDATRMRNLVQRWQNSVLPSNELKQMRLAVVTILRDYGVAFFSTSTNEDQRRVIRGAVGVLTILLQHNAVASREEVIELNNLHDWLALIDTIRTDEEIAQTMPASGNDVRFRAIRIAFSAGLALLDDGIESWLDVVTSVNVKSETVPDKGPLEKEEKTNLSPLDLRRQAVLQRLARIAPLT